MPNNLKVSEKTKDILSYESLIFSTADTLRGNVTTKEAMWPGFMMPFFALMMIESRLIRAWDQACQDPDLTTEEARIAEVKIWMGDRFYNAKVIEEGRTLATIVKSDTYLEKDLDEYLEAFNTELRSLLGVRNGKDEDNLNIEGKIASLREKGVLLEWLGKWSQIDFTPYDNSEITTLEEHIKRKWADMSAETAGQQYTPSDIIRLIAMLSGKITLPNGPLKIYDMTCGGGNMLYGTEDHLNASHPGLSIKTYGQEMEGSLYSLAKVESMFRKNSTIVRGNTLTEDKLSSVLMNLIVANPPYGVDWKDVKAKIEADQTGRFKAGKPSTSDGQLLFVQHALAKLDEECGYAFIVLNGSPLFTGDAGSGESNIRKWILDNDYLEALIQLPTNEFFNTGITTYIWCLNVNKSAARKDKILCINAENEFVKLKKNKGNKSNEISLEQAQKIVGLYESFDASDISVVKSKYDFYYNRQFLMRLEKDDEFGAFVPSTKADEEGAASVSEKVEGVHTITISERNPEGRVGFVRISTQVEQPSKEEAARINVILKGVDSETHQLSVFANNASYRIDEKHCVIKTTGSAEENLGYGNLAVKATYKKATKAEPEKVVFDVAVEQVWLKDEERVAYSPDASMNDKNVRDFMKEWVSEDEMEYELLDASVGVEVNFNSVFPKKLKIRSTAEILAEIALLDAEIAGV